MPCLILFAYWSLNVIKSVSPVGDKNRRHSHFPVVHFVTMYLNRWWMKIGGRKQVRVLKNYRLVDSVENFIPDKQKSNFQHHKSLLKFLTLVLSFNQNVNIYLPIQLAKKINPFTCTRSSHTALGMPLCYQALRISVITILLLLLR